MKVGVICLGNLGSAIANLIAANRYDVIGWEHNAPVVGEINTSRTNSRCPRTARQGGLGCDQRPRRP